MVTTNMTKKQKGRIKHIFSINIHINIYPTIKIYLQKCTYTNTVLEKICVNVCVCTVKSQFQVYL